ncbi:MAG: exodeoxyribonuclease VII small subunit [Dehalococcoidia bacterium]
MEEQAGQQNNSIPSPARGPSRDNRRSESFEKSFTKLEETVRRLEAGQLTLDEATKLFEEGMRLARRCNELLTTTELKVSRLQSQFAEQMSLVPGDSEYEDDIPEEEDD